MDETRQAAVEPSKLGSRERRIYEAGVADGKIEMSDALAAARAEGQERLARLIEQARAESEAIPLGAEAPVGIWPKGVSAYALANVRIAALTEALALLAAAPSSVPPKEKTDLVAHLRACSEAATVREFTSRPVYVAGLLATAADELERLHQQLQELADLVLASATVETSRGLIAKALAVEKVRGPQ